MWLLIVAVIAFLVIKHRHDKNSNLLELQRIVLVDSPDRLIMSESQLMNAATVQAQNDMRIIKDCASLVSSTTKPDVFFSRLELLLKTSRHLMLFEPYLPFKGASPSAAYNEAVSKKDECVWQFITRYSAAVRDKADSMKTEKGKANQYQKYYDSMKPHYGGLSTDNKRYFERTYKQMIE